MQKNRWAYMLVVLAFIWITGCGEGEGLETNIQKNQAEGFTLMEVFDGEGALEEAWDALDGELVNEKFSETVDLYPGEFVTFSEVAGAVLTEEPSLMPLLTGKDTSEILAYLMDPHPSHRMAEGIAAFYGGTTVDQHTRGFYALLDDLSVDVPLMDEGYANQIIYRIIARWMHTNTPVQVAEDMQELIDDIEDPEFPQDFRDLSGTLGKLLIRSDYPMWKDGEGNLLNAPDIDPEADENLHLGNIVAGVHALATGFDEIMGDDEARLAIHQVIKGLGNIFDPELDLAAIMRSLICEMEDRLTVGGAIYENDPVYHGETGEIYSNAELGGTLREVAPYLMQYFFRADREMAMISDPFGTKPYPLGILGQNLHRMGWDMENARIEESVYDMLRYDIWGRDRVTDPEAFHTSFLENLMFFASLGFHIGYNDGGKTGEVTDSADPNFDHGHGEGRGTLTLNDVLFAMTTHKTLGMGMYDISLQEGDYNYMYRGRAPFTADGPGMDEYRFRYDQNYPIGLMLAGTPGDMGSPQGGKPPLDVHGEPVLNGYRAYCATGVEEDNVALNTMSASVRAAWHAEGPYYCAAKAGETVSFDGRAWEVTYTPAGLVYAWVHKPSDDPKSWEYVYPSQYEGQTMEDQASLAVQYGAPSLALFTSDIDLSGGVDNGIWTGRKLAIDLGEGYQASISFRDNREYHRDEIMAMINDAFGETVCFPHDESGGEYLRIVSPYGPINLDNAAFNPLGAFFKDGAALGDEVNVAVLAFPATDVTSELSISVDGAPAVAVDFINPSRAWTQEMVMERLEEAGLTVLPFGSGIEILGGSGDPAVGRIIATDISGSGVADFLKGQGGTLTRYVNRMERYKDTWRSDYYLGKVGGDYYTVAYGTDGNLAMPKVASHERAGSMVVSELIDEADPGRECATQEEALFRNYQFFFAERKFVLVMPIHVSVNLLGIEAFIFQVMEANGYTGFMNGRKYLGNQVWAKKRADGPSSIPGDYRLCIRVVNNGLLADLAVTEESVYNDTLDCGVSFNAIIPHNSPVIYRMGFPRAPVMTHGTDADGNPVTDYLVGSREFEVGDELWQNRSAVLVLLQALWGSLHSHTEVGYESTQGGMLSFFDMMAYILKPLFYYQKEAGQWPRKSWKPRIVDGQDYLYPSARFYSDTPMATWYGSEEERAYYRPAQVPTLITMLTDSDPYGDKAADGMPARCDGLLARITEYDVETGNFSRSRFLTGLLNLMQELGDARFDDDAPPSITDGSAEEGDAWGPRRRILYGLEQVTSAVRMTKGTATALNENRNNPITYPGWLFSEGSLDAPTHMRDEDLHLDWGIDLLVGEDAVEGTGGRGLADYPDARETEEDWQDLTETVSLLSDLLYESSPHSITGVLLNLLDSALAKPEPYDRDDMAGALYALGRIFSRFDGEQSRWVTQGEEGFDALYRVLKERLPAMHDVIRDDTGANYHASLVIINDLLKESGLVEAVVDQVTIPSDWEAIVNDLYHFLIKEKVTEPDPLWSTLADLLLDLGHAIDLAQDITRLLNVYEKYGIQVNN